MWVPPEEKDPVLLHAPTRKSISVFGAVRIDTGRLLTRSFDIFNAVTFLEFLNHIIERTYRKRVIHMVLDNSRYHHAKLLKPWLDEHKEEIVLDFLPPYSPELNPIERVWKLTRRLCVHNRYFPMLEDLTNAVDGQFELWETPNTTLRRLCAVI
jgi:transposase